MLKESFRHQEQSCLDLFILLVSLKILSGILSLSVPVVLLFLLHIVYIFWVSVTFRVRSSVMLPEQNFSRFLPAKKENSVSCAM